MPVWCDNGATVSFEGHLGLPYPATKFPTFCDNIVNNPTDLGICPFAGNCDGVSITGGAGLRAALTQMIRENKLLAVSPNPAQQEIYLDTKNLKEKMGAIRIYNTYGKLIETFDNQEFNTFSKQIDISAYENGLYFLNIKMKGLPMVTQRFVVESLR